MLPRLASIWNVILNIIHILHHPRPYLSTAPHYTHTPRMRYWRAPIWTYLAHNKGFESRLKVTDHCMCSAFQIFQIFQILWPIASKIQKGRLHQPSIHPKMRFARTRIPAWHWKTAKTWGIEMTASHGQLQGGDERVDERYCHIAISPWPSPGRLRLLMLAVPWNPSVARSPPSPVGGGIQRARSEAAGSGQKLKQFMPFHLMFTTPTEKETSHQKNEILLPKHIRQPLNLIKETSINDVPPAASFRHSRCAHYSPALPWKLTKMSTSSDVLDEICRLGGWIMNILDETSHLKFPSPHLNTLPSVLLLLPSSPRRASILPFFFWFPLFFLLLSNLWQVVINPASRI